MISTIFKSGNSSAIRLSKDLMDDLDLKPNDQVQVKVDNGKIIISKYELRQSIDDYFKDWKGGYPEFDTAFDNQVGEEHL